MLNLRARHRCHPSTGISGRATGLIPLGSAYCHVYPLAKSRAQHMLTVNRQIWKRVDDGVNLLNSWQVRGHTMAGQKQVIPLNSCLLHFQVLHFTLFFWGVLDVWHYIGFVYTAGGLDIYIPLLSPCFLNMLSTFFLVCFPVILACFIPLQPPWIRPGMFLDGVPVSLSTFTEHIYWAPTTCQALVKAQPLSDTFWSTTM